MPESKADEAFVDAVDAVQDKGRQKRKKKALHNKVPGDDDLKLIQNPETPIDAISSHESEEDVAKVKTEGVEAPVSMEGEVMRKETTAEVWERLGIDRKRNVSPDEAAGRIPSTEEMRELQFFNASGSGVGNPRGNDGVERNTKFSLKKRDRLSGIDEGTAEEGNSQELPPPHQASVQSQQGEDGLSEMLCSPTPILGESFAPTATGDGIPRKISQSSSGARDRWRRLKHTVAFAHHVSHQARHSANDLLEENANELLRRENSLTGDAGGTGAAEFDGAKTGANSRPKGRKGMEGMLVRQDKRFVTMMQDFYVACLKMPMGRFLLGVFLAPVALGLLFTPVFCLDMAGLSYDGMSLAQLHAAESSVAATRRWCTVLINVFLYALSLSTTFGGSPVTALSPFCLLVANVNTLMAQFLFVFLSGAVFARMSQPSQPVRCSKKAIIRCDDFVPTPGEEKFRVFAVRLVLTGPAPCELVDAKICLTFRIFVQLPSGSMFCSTQNLELVRPEVSYLRYGLMVRHIIDKKSPVYGQTMESLRDGDASFSLTIMGLERTSMQPIFHLEDYFVADGDVVWDGDYMDFIHINRDGHRVLDHSKIDLLKTFKVAGVVTQAISRMEGDVARRKHSEQMEKEKDLDAKYGSGDDGSEVVRSMKGWVSLRARKLWKSKSTSFTRAPDW
ncbi:unnamed protein product [Sphagnum compactum]